MVKWKNESGEKMFDILVDTRRKRLGLVLLVMAGLLFFLMASDLFYVTGIFSSRSTSALLARMDGSSTSFYARLIVFLLNSSLTSLSSWLAIGLEYLFVLLRSLTNLEWLLVIGLLLFVLSHQERISRFMLYILTLHFILRFILAGALTLVFGEILATNDIHLLLNGVHYLSLAAMIIHAGMLVVLGYYIYTVWIHVYLAAFRKKDASNG